MAFGLGGALGGLIGGAISSALGGGSKKPSSGSSSSGSSSSSTSRPTSSNGGNKYTGNTSFNASTDYAQQFYDNQFSNDLGKLQTILDQRLDKLNGQADDWQSSAQNWLNSQYNNQYNPGQSIADQYENQLNGIMNDYQQKEDAIRQEQQAAIDKNVADLNAQKANVQQAGEKSNMAAQQNYMNVLNPNGANAEQLAALGLSQSGMSESAAIAANNAYTNAVNSNEMNVNNQLAAIDLAIQQAKLTGDIATAQQLQAYYDTVLQAGMQNANNILAANQWAISNGQNQVQQGINNIFNQAGLTGNLNGNQTMAGQQLSYTIEGMSLDNQLKQFTLLLQKTYGMDQAAAQLEAQKLANTGANLANEYQKIYNQYLQSKM